VEQPTGPATAEDRQVAVETDKHVYEAGAPITITISNGLTQTVSYMGFCSLYPCQRTPEGWLCMMKECHGPTTELPPGGRDVLRDAGMDLPGATLRYELCYGVGATPDAVPGVAHSNLFTIEPRQTVPEDDLAAFMALLRSADYQAIRRSGQELFKPGLSLPNHSSLFGDYSSEQLPDGRVRYELLTIEGEASVAWVFLFIEGDTGKIAEFSAGEATH
jgi:hypothetical protein